MQTVEHVIEVEAPVSKVYNQWTQFEEFPEFMEGVQEVRQLDDKRQRWVADIAGKREEGTQKSSSRSPTSGSPGGQLQVGKTWERSLSTSSMRIEPRFARRSHISLKEQLKRWETRWASFRLE